MAVAKIQSGMADCIIAGGAESMSSVPMTGFKPELNYDTVAAGHEEYYWGMGNTAEAVANNFSVCKFFYSFFHHYLLFRKIFWSKYIFTICFFN